jgi:hypothetical protein
MDECADFDDDKRELQRLQSFFEDKVIKVVMRHPEHGCVASCSIPIHHGEGFEDFLSVDHELTFHTKLSANDYAKCEVAMQLLPDLDFIACLGYNIEDMEDMEEALSAGRSKKDKKKKQFPHERTLFWVLTPYVTEPFEAKFVGLQNEEFECSFHPTLSLHLGCNYPPDTSDDDAEVAVPHGVKGSVIIDEEATIESEFEFLKMMEAWYVAAMHTRADVIEKERLQERFRDTFLLTEVEFMGEMLAFCCVRLTDKAALQTLFEEHTTRLQFVPGAKEEVPEEVDALAITVSIWDLDTQRRIKLSEIFPCNDTLDHCQFVFLDRSASFQFSIDEGEGEEGEEGKGVGGGGGGGGGGITMQLLFVLDPTPRLSSGRR